MTRKSDGSSDRPNSASLRSATIAARSGAWLTPRLGSLEHERLVLSEPANAGHDGQHALDGHDGLEAEDARRQPRQRELVAVVADDLVTGEERRDLVGEDALVPDVAGALATQ